MHFKPVATGWRAHAMPLQNVENIIPRLQYRNVLLYELFFAKDEFVNWFEPVSEFDYEYSCRKN